MLVGYLIRALYLHEERLCPILTGSPEVRATKEDFPTPLAPMTRTMLFIPSELLQVPKALASYDGL
jgi:hypothetical protein